MINRVPVDAKPITHEVPFTLDPKESTYWIAHCVWTMLEYKKPPMTPRNLVATLCVDSIDDDEGLLEYTMFGSLEEFYRPPTRYC